ncbi:tryptophan--tRNA ligase [Puniceicoccales bacterium CK1056]|uniref:Tryptophan--tRNA ligase n=1 Tax=Oceanipulchritudo coccoides TaxID=2706888 RepID=A0A6B2M140_9BACT|nr:tryptophan--tRNA ligase [Oceanipulchritudo coccoides]NDV62122.1 tryptophan--tRNA ligase [Oceanipulchritudo coccoides]
MSSPEKKVILTCAQPTGQLHLGNYFGALRNWASMIDDYECFFGIVDQHAITLPYVPAELRQATYRNLALYIACGLDPSKCHLFCQSHIIGHTELAWVLGCLCPIGQLERMTQFKDKSQREDSGFIGAGLLNYPVLMAADILLYNADRVPVGEDQKQHVELCRDLAIKFNNTYSETFRVPEVYIPKTGARIKSLQDPLKKMSKSDANQSGCVYLLDSPKTIRKKIRSAVTDSGSEVRAGKDKPGITNLLTIFSSATGRSVEDLEKQFEGSQYGPFKDAVADAVINALEPIQAKYEEIHNDKAYLDSVFKQGAEVAQKRAYKMISKVYRKAGFAPRT